MNYVRNVLGESREFDEADALKAAISDFKEKGQTWVFAEEIKKHMLEQYEVLIEERRLGRIMKAWGYTRRYNPKAQYRIG